MIQNGPTAKHIKSLLNPRAILRAAGVCPITEILNLIPNLEPRDRLIAWGILVKCSYAAPQPVREEDQKTIKINYSVVKP